MSHEENKATVRLFNESVIEQGDRHMFEQLVSVEFVNHSALPGAPADRESLWNTFERLLRPALRSLAVVIHEQIAEGDLVTTRKTVRGIHTGVLAGIAPTHREIEIQVIDIVRVIDGRYMDHWGINTLPSVLETLRQCGA